MEKVRVIIMGAAGRDFHNFNVFFRNRPEYEVVAFTATQIPNIEGRVYPKELAGELYPNGIPIYPESDLPKLIKELNVHRVVFAYSDVPHEYVMHKASIALANGADFWLMGPDATMVKSTKPVVSVCAVRTGSGKSQTTRKVVRILREMGKKVVSIRHPMPYGNLVEQAVQRFATYEDLDRYKCTIEEREEYEPHIDLGAVIYSGVDYEKILREAEKEADIIVWDGGNNDFPFYKSDLRIVVADPLRAGHELTYHPGETNFRSADVIVINKEDTADFESIELVRNHAREVNPNAVIIDAASPIFVDNGEIVRGKKVVVVEDGPTLTHGEMSYGAGYIAARKLGASEIISPVPYAVGSIKSTYEKYSQTKDVLPAMGYSDVQIRELEQTINSIPADVVVIGTPIDLRRVIKINKPAVRVRYELQEIGKPDLKDILTEKFGG
ncbi:cyclic 2,3-diphosphoglycerate synthase [Caldisericum sp.]|jgi:predicted GTPase|uniref:cyclic 2,3-diphosphoglycerate synthase n=1 Tax=Caldisericum sp. TaxID=2499687 RepID=UPI003D10B682